jgi:hypothetical protein
MAKKPETKKQEVAVMAETGVVPQQAGSRWGTGPALSKKDLLISKIMVQQPMSVKVTAGEASFGELRDSVSNEVLGSFSKSLTFIPFHWQLNWVEKDWNKQEDDYVYARTIPITPENEDLPYEEEGKVKRIYTINVFCMLPHELDRDGTAFPHIIAFRSSSLKSGRKLLTQMAQIRAGGLSPAAYNFDLIVRKETKDKHTYAVIDVQRGALSTPEQDEAAFTWYQTLVSQKASFKVDESDVMEKEVAAPEAESGPRTTGKF